MVASFDVSIVIPSWNGLHLLRENLPSVLTAARAYREHTGGATEVVVVDDGSEDGTSEAIQPEFSDVRIVRHSENQGFAAASNRGFRESRFSLVALLNNDVRVEESYLIFQALHFQDEDVFAVTAKVFERDSRVLTSGGAVGEFRRGLWSFSANYDVSGGEAREWVEKRRLLSAYAAGGFSTYHRGKLELLGGFIELLSPFYWEDVDLSFRGWKRGWIIRYEPRSVAYHQTSATIGIHFSQSFIRTVSVRNRLLFHWINLNAPVSVLSHLSMLLLLLLSRIFVLDIAFYRSFLEAVRRTPEVRKLRRTERRSSQRSTSELSTLWREFYRIAPIEVYRSREQVMERHPDSKAAEA